MDQYLAEFQRDGGVCQPLASWTGRADSQQLFGTGSPLKPGMLVIAMGWAWNGSGATPIVQVPPGWSNFGFSSNGISGVRSGTGAWAKLLLEDETPNFFTNHSETALHFYGFPAPDSFNVVNFTGSTNTPGAPSSESVVRSGGVNTYNGGPALLAGVFASSGAPTSDAVAYNGSTSMAQVRDAMNGTSLKSWARLTYIKRLTTDIDFSMGDHGTVNHYCGGLLNLAGIY